MKKAALRIYSSSGCRQNCGIISEAVTRLTEEGMGSRIHFNDVSSGIGNGSLLVIDGNHEKHNWEKLRSLNIEPDFHLVVTDLGLETVDDEFSDDDIQLLLDGIKAECTVTQGPTPKFNCPCCG
ncbi:MAG: hypothetical protein GY799_28610 [Desulfobulbaceae bacterium]|nr:hypothetical protein [Desulfobulbaceae bacterium]